MAQMSVKKDMIRFKRALNKVAKLDQETDLYTLKSEEEISKAELRKKSD